MKRKIAIAVLMCMCLTLTACGGYTGSRKLEHSGKVVYDFADSIIDGENYDKENVNTALTEFSIRLLEKNMLASEEKNKNILISPVSVISALGMTSFGAKGDTLTQMEEVFGVSRGNLTWHNNLFLNPAGDELKMANSIWFTNDGRLTVKDEFLYFNKDIYEADVFETAFDSSTVKDINRWVEENTDGGIKEILDEIPPDAVMYLINALIFEAEWEEKYDTTQIRKSDEFMTGDGETQKVDMMCSYEHSYIADESTIGVVKYYKDRKYAFVGLLPWEEMDITEYVKSLTGEQLQNLLGNIKSGVVETKIPQFSYEYDVEMSELLKEMGMTDAFSSKADFSLMAVSQRGNIYLNRVLHKTFIEVSPVGTKAGAATVVEAMDECAPMYDKLQVVELDRPFVYMIIDFESGMPVFMGVVNSIK